MFKHEWLEKLERMFTGRSVEVARYKLVLERVGPDEFEARRDGDLLFAGTLDRMAGWLAQRKQGNFLLSGAIAWLMLALAAPAFAQWNWSPNADYHAAVVKVSIPGQAGSGALISAEPGIVATAKHVVAQGGVSPTANIEWANGYRATGRLIGNGQQTDLAFYAVDVPPESTTTPLADAMPAVGDVVEICGYGGPTKQLRHFSGRVLASDADRLQIDAYVISGDSGGAILHNGRLVAVNWGGNSRTAYVGEDGEEWPLVYPATGWGLGPINRILTQCQGGYCPPQGGVQGGVIGFGRIRYIEPAPQRGSTSPPRQPAPAQELTPVPPSSASIDIAKLQAAMAKVEVTISRMESRINEIEQKQSEPQTLSEADVNRIVAGVVVSIEANPVFRGPAGPAGPKGDKGDMGAAGQAGASAAPTTMTNEEIERIAGLVGPRIKAFVNGVPPQPK